MKKINPTDPISLESPILNLFSCFDLEKMHCKIMTKLDESGCYWRPSMSARTYDGGIVDRLDYKTILGMLVFQVEMGNRRIFRVKHEYATDLPDRKIPSFRKRSISHDFVERSFQLTMSEFSRVIHEAFMRGAK